MCGRFNVTDDPRLSALLTTLGVSLPSASHAVTQAFAPKHPQFSLDFHTQAHTETQPISNTPSFIFSDDIAPASNISIVLQAHQTRRIQTANWWLLQKPDNGSFVPSYQYASFNSRSDKLNVKGSASYEAYRQHRCIIPASGFVEGLGDKKTYHAFIPQQEAIAFAGLYRIWDTPNGERYFSTSIITVAPHNKMTGIHEKPFPLMLNPSYSALIDAWLDPCFTDVAAFDDVLSPILLQDFALQPINKPSQRQPIGTPRIIPSDFS